jgi:hypothetical protein
MGKHAAPELPPQARYTELRVDAHIKLWWITDNFELPEGRVHATMSSILPRAERLGEGVLAEALEADYGEGELVHVCGHDTGRPIIAVAGSVETYEQVVCRLAALTLPEPQTNAHHAHRSGTITT